MYILADHSISNPYRNSQGNYSKEVVMRTRQSSRVQNMGTKLKVACNLGSITLQLYLISIKYIFSSSYLYLQL